MANLVYMNEESAITWEASGGTEPFTLTSLAADAGRQGDLYDFGVAARSRKFVWRARVQFATAPVVGETVRIYIKTSDGTYPDNDDGVSDAAVSAEDKLNNLYHIGNIVVDEAATGVTMVASGEVELSARYVAPVFWNGTADALSSTASHHGFSLTPVPDEIQ